MPAFHAARCSAAPAQTRAVLNLGGIANLTLLRAGRPRDRLRLRPGQRADGRAGASAIAASRSTPTAPGPPAARSTPRCCAALLAEPYFALPPPKSTGRDLFNRGLARRAPGALRARAGAGRRAGHAGRTDRVARRRRAASSAMRRARALLVCGGGALNAPPDAPAWRSTCRGVRGRHAPTTLGCRPIRSRRWPSPGWRTRFMRARSRATCRGHRRARPAAPRRAATRRSNDKGRPEAAFGAVRATLRPRSSSRSRRWWWRSGS